MIEEHNDMIETRVNTTFIFAKKIRLDNWQLFSLYIVFVHEMMASHLCFDLFNCLECQYLYAYTLILVY